MSFNQIIGRIVARTSRLSVDSILSTMHQQLAALENTSNALRRRANRRGATCAALHERSAVDLDEADRADRIRRRLSDLFE